MHIGLDFETNVLSLEKNITKVEMDPSVSSFQKNITSNKNEHFKWPHETKTLLNM